MKRILCFVLSISILLYLPIIVSAGELQKENVNAKSSILMDIDSKTILYADNEYEHLSPASVTKIMSILLVLESIENGDISLHDKVTASKNAVSMGGSQIWLEEGESMTVDELLKAVIVASANDACTALGEYVGGSSVAFVDMMNKRAEELGLKNTHFENCTGLDDTVKSHYSCAYDLAMIACEVMKHELVLDYTKIWLDSLRDGKTELNNTNKLINTYDGITGLKTGTTSNAGFCVCATANRDNLNLVSVVLGSQTSEERFNTASYLLDYGFSNFKTVQPKIDDKKIKSVKVISGKLKSIKPICEDKSTILLDKDCKDLEYEYKIDSTVTAPVKKGQCVGEIVIKSDKKTISTLKIVSPIKIEKIDFYTIFSHLIINI